MYFGDEEAANAQDLVLNIIEQPERRKTLIAAKSVRDGATIYTFDIYLQARDCVPRCLGALSRPRERRFFAPR